MTQAPTLAAAAAPRFNLYQSVHKGLRAFMADTLRLVGSADGDDPVERDEALAQLRSLLHVCREHLAHENDFIHTAMERRSPGSAAGTAQEHVEHVAHIAGLSALASQAEAARGPAAADAWLTLYHALSAFVAENYEHMLTEERAHNAVLWAHYSDPELLEIHGALVGSIPPEEMALHFRWMLPQLSHAERVGMLMGARPTMPAPVFDAFLAQAQGLLTPHAWGKLAAALQLDAQPVHAVVQPVRAAA